MDRTPEQQEERDPRITRREALAKMGGGMAVAAVAPGLFVPSVEAKCSASEISELRTKNSELRTDNTDPLVPRCNHTTTLLATGGLLIAGGFCTRALSSAQIYLSDDEGCVSAAPMGTARQQHTATSLADGRVLIAGGLNGRPMSSTEIFDPYRNTWTPAAPMNFARFGHTAVALPDGNVMVIGGHDQTPMASAEIYEPATNSWMKIG